MSEPNDPAYYAARAQRARALAEAASDREIAEIHRRMAESYSQLARLVDSRRVPLRIVSDQ